MYGSYLSALVLFGTITGLDPQSLGAAEIAARDLGISPHAALLLADLPGVNQDGLKLHLDDEQIELEGTVAPGPQGSTLGREFRPIDFRRSFVMPQGIDVDKVSAELKNGVLWLHLPKSAAVKPRRIAVTQDRPDQHPLGAVLAALAADEDPDRRLARRPQPGERRQRVDERSRIQALGPE